MRYLMGVLAIIAGGFFAYLEVFGVHEYMTAAGANWDYVMQMTLGVCAIFALLPAFARLAKENGNRGASLGIWLAFWLVGLVILFAGISRSGTASDAAQLGRENAALDRRLALADEASTRKRLETDQANVDRECANVPKGKDGKPLGTAIGPGCRAAMAARDASQEKLDAAVSKLRETKGGLRDAAGARIEWMTRGLMTEQTFRDVYPIAAPLVGMVLSACLLPLGISLLMGDRRLPKQISAPSTVEIVKPEPLPVPSMQVEHVADNVTQLRPRPKPPVRKPRQIASLPAASLMKFVADCTEKQDGARADLEKLFGAYVSFCVRNDMTALDAATFVKDMHKLCNAIGGEIDGAEVLDMALTA